MFSMAGSPEAQNRKQVRQESEEGSGWPGAISEVLR